MDFEFETEHTGLANDFAAAGANWLAYMGITDTVLAPIPCTQPQKYAIAGTLPGILQMAGKMIDEDAATPAVEPVAWMRRNLKECKTDAEVKHMASLEFGCWKEIAASYTIPLYAAPAHPVSAAEKPTDDLTYEQIMENYRELGGETWGQSQQAVADAFRNHVGAIATDDAAGPYVKFRFRSMADADAALESIIASFSLPVSQEGAHAALEEVHHQWISMDDRRPEDGETVLIVCHDPHDPEPGMWAAQWLAGSETFESRTNGWVHASEVTHWMPLPPAPTPACAERSGDRADR